MDWLLSMFEESRCMGHAMSNSMKPTVFLSNPRKRVELERSNDLVGHTGKKRSTTLQKPLPTI